MARAIAPLESAPIAWNQSKVWRLSDYFSFSGVLNNQNVVITAPSYMNVALSHPSGVPTVSASLNVNNPPSGGWISSEYTVGVTIAINDGAGVASDTAFYKVVFAHPIRVRERISDKVLQPNSDNFIGNLEGVFENISESSFTTGATTSRNVQSTSLQITPRIVASVQGQLPDELWVRTGSNARGTVIVSESNTFTNQLLLNAGTKAETSFRVSVQDSPELTLDRPVPDQYIYTGDVVELEMRDYFVHEGGLSLTLNSMHTTIDVQTEGSKVIVAGLNTNGLSVNVVRLTASAFLGGTVEVSFVVYLLPVSQRPALGSMTVSIGGDNAISISASASQIPTGGLPVVYQWQIYNDDQAFMRKTTGAQVSFTPPKDAALEWNVEGVVLFGQYASEVETQQLVTPPFLSGDVEATPGEGFLDVNLNYRLLSGSTRRVMAASDISNLKISLFGNSEHRYDNQTLSTTVFGVYTRLVVPNAGVYSLVVSFAANGVDVESKQSVTVRGDAAPTADGARITVDGSSVALRQWNYSTGRQSTDGVLRLYTGKGSVRFQSELQRHQVLGKKVQCWFADTLQWTAWVTEVTIHDEPGVPRELQVSVASVYNELSKRRVDYAQLSGFQRVAMKHVVEDAGFEFDSDGEGALLPPLKLNQHVGINAQGALRELEKYGGALYEDVHGRIRFNTLTSSRVTRLPSAVNEVESDSRVGIVFNYVSVPAPTIRLGDEVSRDDNNGDKALELGFYYFTKFDLTKVQSPNFVRAHKEGATVITSPPNTENVDIHMTMRDVVNDFTPDGVVEASNAPNVALRGRASPPPERLPRFIENLADGQVAVRHILDSSSQEQLTVVRAEVVTATDDFAAMSELRVGEIVNWGGSNYVLEHLMIRQNLGTRRVIFTLTLNSSTTVQSNRFQLDVSRLDSTDALA